MLSVEAIKNFSIDKSDWQKVKFGDVVFEPKESVKDPVAEGIKHVVGLEHIDSEDIHLRRSASIEESTTFTKKFSEGDVLFGRRRAYLKKAAKAEFEGICSGDITVMRAREETLLPELLPFIVNNDNFFEHAIIHSAGGLSPRVKFKDLANYEFFIPTKEQQTNLVKLFTASNHCIESYREEKKYLGSLKKKLAYDCYYSLDAKKICLGDLCVKIQDGSHFSPQNIYDSNYGGRYRYVTSKNIRTNGLEFKTDQFVDKDFHESIYKRCDTVKGDILLTKDGASTGAATINSLDEEISLLSSVCLIRAKPDLISNEYICQYINSDIGTLNLTNQMTGTAITRLTLTTLRKIKIPVHDKGVMDDITSKLNQFDSCIENTNKCISECLKLKKSIISKVF